MTVFEKARGPSGRASTRRYGEVGFDHGAQYFTARDPVFKRALAAWLESGLVQPWHARMARFDNGALQSSPDRHARYVAVPGMNALGKFLARDLTLHCRTRVAPPTLRDGQWQLHDEDDAALGSFDALIIAAPAPQAAELLRPQAASFADVAAAVQYDPMWALMAEIADDTLALDGVFVKDAPFSWIARNHAKPGRAGAGWVAHAAPEWTRAHLEIPAAQAATLLGESMAQLLGVAAERVVVRGAHRWLYSLVPQPLDVGALYEPTLHLAVCGDWCQGARIEGAYLSGLAAAGRLLGHLAQQAGPVGGIAGSQT